MGPISGKVFRKATESDLDRLVEIHRVAYPDGRSGDHRKRVFTHNRFGGLDRLIVVEEAGLIVGHAFLFPVRAFFGGAPVKMGAIASVGVAPEARGRGIATALLDHLHRLSSRREEALTMLYAFRHGFYARLGYATTSSTKRLAIDTRSVPQSWRELARSNVRAFRTTDAALVRRLYTQAAKRASGWIERPHRRWERLFSNEHQVFLLADRGYVAFAIVQDEAHAETIAEVDELVAVDSLTRRALLGALAGMRDQISEIVITVPEDDPLERALIDPDGRRFGTVAVEHDFGQIVGGPMVRLTEVERALEARGYSGTGNFEIELTDEPIATSVRITKGRAAARPLSKPSAGRFQTTRAGLAAILYGGLAPSAAVALGLAQGKPELVAKIEALVRMAPLSPIDAF